MVLKDKSRRQLFLTVLLMMELYALVLAGAITMTVWACWENWLGGADGNQQSIWMGAVAADLYVVALFPLLRGAAAAWALFNPSARRVIAWFMRFVNRLRPRKLAPA